MIITIDNNKKVELTQQEAYLYNKNDKAFLTECKLKELRIRSIKCSSL